MEHVFRHPNTNEVVSAHINDEYSYCFRKEKADESTVMIACDSRACPNGIWFHLDCVNIRENEIPETFTCSDNCRLYLEQDRWGREQKTSDDSKADYSKALLLHGLLELCRRDAIRENDGAHMMVHWKHSMFQLSNHHCKYIIQASLNIKVLVF